MPFRQAKWTSRGRPFQKAELGHRSVVDASRGFHMSTADRSAFVLPDFSDKARWPMSSRTLVVNDAYSRIHLL